MCADVGLRTAVSLVVEDESRNGASSSSTSAYELHQSRSSIGANSGSDASHSLVNTSLRVFDLSFSLRLLPHSTCIIVLRVSCSCARACSFSLCADSCSSSFILVHSY